MPFGFGECVAVKLGKEAESAIKLPEKDRILRIIRKKIGRYPIFVSLITVLSKDFYAKSQVQRKLEKIYGREWKGSGQPAGFLPDDI